MKLFSALVFCLLQISWCKVDKTWWKYTTMYQVFLPSFKDDNGDGMGDLKGLISKLDYFVDLGIETVYITPYFESPMVDAGYDITNYMSVNPLMGTMEDFDTLVKEMNERGLKLVIDLVINHCSDQHPWFVKSINREKPYDDYYIWKDPKGYDANGVPIPPNNWLSYFGGSMWTWNNQRKQFYFHQFTPQQPDFDLRNKATKTMIKKIIKFWLDKGVAGFRVDAAKYLLEDAQFRDEPLVSPDIKGPPEYTDLDHIYTTNVPETYEFLREIRIFIDRAAKKYTDFERGVLLSENYSQGEELVRYYGTEKHRIVQLPLNFNLVRVGYRNYENASYYHNIITSYLDSLPEWATPTWNAENHDKYRKAFLLHEEFEFIFASMVMMLPGTAYIYYGQEIGVTGSKIRPDQKVDYVFNNFNEINRDYFRHPMPWDDTLNGGFSSNDNLYLPMDPNYWRINVKKQQETKNSYYHMFKKMVALKKTKTLKYGNCKSYVISTWVLGISRKLEDRESYYVIFNFGSETEFIDLHNSIEDLPKSLTIEIASPNSGYKVGDKVKTTQQIPKILILRPVSVVVLSTRDSEHTPI